MSCPYKDEHEPGCPYVIPDQCPTKIILDRLLTIEDAIEDAMRHSEPVMPYFVKEKDISLN